jgi:hypothetical protein
MARAERFDAIAEPVRWARLPVQAVFVWLVWRLAIARPRP